MTNTPKPQANTLDEILAILRYPTKGKWSRVTIAEKLRQEKAVKIQALITEKVVKLAKLYGEPRCENLHHSKKNQHTFIEVCPVVKAISEQLKENN